MTLRELFQGLGEAFALTWELPAALWDLLLDTPMETLLLLLIGVGGPWFIIVAISKYREDRSLFKNSRERWYTWAAIEERDEDFESARRRREDHELFIHDMLEWYRRAGILRTFEDENYAKASARRDRGEAEEKSAHGEE